MDKHVFVTNFLRMISSYNEYESIPKNYGTDISLTVSEIHTVEAIGKNEPQNISQIARELGISRVSASEVISKLEKKGLALKTDSSSSARDKSVWLTEKGRTAFEGHTVFHEKQYSEFNTLLDSVTDDELEFLNRSVLDFEKTINQLKNS